MAMAICGLIRCALVHVLRLQFLFLEVAEASLFARHGVLFSAYPVSFRLHDFTSYLAIGVLGPPSWRIYRDDCAAGRVC